MKRNYYIQESREYKNCGGQAEQYNIKETINYYPFGSEMTMTPPDQITPNQDWQPYRFTGKELMRQNSLNMYDFGARWFDVAGVPMWTSMDPLAEMYYHLNPYMYCAGDPVNYVDPNGMDYWSTSDPEEIAKFLNTVGSSGTQHDFSGWNHATDAEILGNLVYNDETHKFYTSYTKVINNEIFVIGKSFDANITPVSFSGQGYEGAFVYEPIDGFWLKANHFLNGTTYNDGNTNWSVNIDGRITGVQPIIGIPPAFGKSYKANPIINGRQKIGRIIGNTPGNNKVQNKQVERIAKELGLNAKQTRILHDEIHGQGYNYQEARQVAIDLFGIRK